MERVRIFSSPTCPYCRQAKEFLKSKNIDFEDIDVTSNPDAIQELRQVSGGARSVPVIVIDDIVLIGFEQMELEKALKTKGLL